MNQCSKPNEFFDEKYASELKQVQKAGSEVETTLGTAIRWFANSFTVRAEYTMLIRDHTLMITVKCMIAQQS
ncbi:hypothetical protein U1Q18_049051 [Sarracenia purpurea var. burkii]